MPTARSILRPDGVAAISRLIRSRPLIAFDFDGTLAPIVTQPDAARVPAGIARRLAQLADRLPVAVLTGRAISDVRDRLGFVPRYLVGSHGAEDDSKPEILTARREPLESLRHTLEAQRSRLAGLGILVEDKTFSIALHYRMAPDREMARSTIDQMLRNTDPALHVFGGKLVVNVTSDVAPDKGDAMFSLVARSGADCALFAGDDVNDEVVFAAAPQEWVTIRVGPWDPLSRARYFLPSTASMAILLDQMLADLARSPPRRDPPADPPAPSSA